MSNCWCTYQRCPVKPVVLVYFDYLDASRLLILQNKTRCMLSSLNHHCPNSWSYRASGAGTFHLLSAARHGAGWSFSRPCWSSWLSVSTTACYQSSTFDRWHHSESYLAAQMSCDMCEALLKACCFVWRWHEHIQKALMEAHYIQQHGERTTNMVELWANV